MIGAGNGGQATAAHMALEGHRVNLFDRLPEVIADFRATRHLVVTGAVQGEATLECVTDDLGLAVGGVDLVLVSVPGFALEALAIPLGNALASGQVVILHPGGTGGALRLKAIWNEAGLGSGITIAETETLVYAARLAGPGRPDVKAVKRSISLATLPGLEPGRALEIMSALYPQTRAAANVLEIALANLNPVMHPPIVIGTMRAIESSGPRTEFYGDGISPGVAAMIDGLDAERTRVAGALGIPCLTVRDWVERAYAITSEDTESMIRAMAASVYRGILGPDRLDNRYLSEDVPYGLVPWSELAALAGTRVPLTDAVITLASVVNGVDYRVEGRTLPKLGLGRLDSAGVVRAVRT